MKFTALAVIILMAFGAIICSFISNRYSTENTGGSARVFSTLSIICIIGMSCFMFWQYSDFYTVPRILLLVTICSYVKNKKRKRFCTPFWRKLHVTLLSYIILGGTGFAMYIVKMSTRGSYRNEHIAVIFAMVIPIMLILIIITEIIFGHLLTRRRVSSYYY